MEVTKKDLEQMYKSMTVPSLLEKLDISRPTLYRLLKNNGIALKGRSTKSLKVRVI